MQGEWSPSGEQLSKVFRVELVVCSCGCNGTRSGPTIEAYVGETIVIRLVNHLSESVALDLADAALPLQPTPVIGPGSSGEYQFLLENSGSYNYPWGRLIVFPI